MTSIIENQPFANLSTGLRAKISGERVYTPHPSTPVSNYLAHTKRHCNGGRTVDAGLHLKQHCDKGGKIFLTMSGAGSSFQMGITIADLIRAGKIAAISVTGANLEESLYRLVANSHYAYIRNYEELTPEEEKELDRDEKRRITDTFLPETESVRLILPHLMTLWQEAQDSGKRLLWHEYFFELFARNLITPDPTARLEDCWLYEAWRHNIPIFVGGVEDSTMGNIFAHACYDGTHHFLSQFKLDKPLNPDIVHHSFRYMHSLAEWYMDNTGEHGLVFVQLGGGIAADFPICVVPHLKKDYLAEHPLAFQEASIRPWAGFIEIHTAPMSAGSYSGAGGKEKITWSKLEPGAFMMQIWGDYTSIFPDMAAFVLAQ